MSVLVYTENWDGKFKKLSHELVSYAAGLAAMAGGNVTALSIGNVDQDELSTLGSFRSLQSPECRRQPPRAWITRFTQILLQLPWKRLEQKSW